MLDTIREFFRDMRSAGEDPKVLGARTFDTNLAAAALMVHVMVADGKILPEELARMRSVLMEHYNLDEAGAETLMEEAREADSEATDLYGFTSILKSQLSEAQRMGLVEDLWEMVYADGELNEIEDNVVWRAAELLGITSEKRMALKRVVIDRRKTS